jgi:hypothetical protein
MNGKTDCDDPACQGQGYLEVPGSSTYGTLDAANCASGKVTSGDECGACAGCTAQVGTCEPDIEIWKGQGCPGAPNVGSSLNGGCYSPGIAANNGKGLSYVVSGVDGVAPTCTKGSATSTARSFCQVDLPHYQNGSQQEVSCVKPAGCVLVSGGAACPQGFQAKPIAISKGGCSCDCTAMQTCTTNGLSARRYSSFNCDSSQPYVDLTVDGSCHDAASIVIESVGLSASVPATNGACSDVPKFQVDDTLCCAN